MFTQMKSFDYPVQEGDRRTLAALGQATPRLKLGDTNMLLLFYPYLDPDSVYHHTPKQQELVNYIH